MTSGGRGGLSCVHGGRGGLSCVHGGFGGEAAVKNPMRGAADGTTRRGGGGGTDPIILRWGDHWHSLITVTNKRFGVHCLVVEELAFVALNEI